MATVVIGDGGHAHDICALFDQAAREDDPTAHSRYRKIPHHETYSRGYGETVVIGVHDPQLRAKIAADIGVEDVPWIHPDAHLYHGVTYGYGTHINYAVSAVRTTIGCHTTISPGVTICGDVTIGDRVFIGAGATVTNLVTIGDDAVIGAGAVVLRDVPANVTVMGVPAKQWTGGRDSG